VNSESLDWEFAFAGFRRNRHPMRGVLNAAGVKMYRRPLWDQLFVILTALLPIIALIQSITQSQIPHAGAGLAAINPVPAPVHTCHSRLESFASGHRAQGVPEVVGGEHSELAVAAF